MSSNTLIGLIVTIVIVAITIAVVFYLLSIKNKNDEE